MPGAETTALAIALMALVTYFTRVAGAWFVANTALPPLAQRFLDHLGTSVLAAFVAPALLAGDTALDIGVGAAGVIMLFTRNSLAAMATGTLIAALTRGWLGI